MHEFSYDQNMVTPKYGENEKHCYMDTGSFIVHVKADDSYKDTAEFVEAEFDTLNFELDRTLLKGKNKKVIGLTRDELGGKILTKFVGLRAKRCSCFIDEGSEDKKSKRHKKVCRKKKT